MKRERVSGILLHPTSLPDTPGIGTLGKHAFAFIDWLANAHQTLWQILPLGPTGYGDSPYASFSTFAGNPLLIDLENLVDRGWAEKEDIIPPDYIKSSGFVDYGSVVWWKKPLLKRIASYFLLHCSKDDSDAYRYFKNQHASWLDSYADFMSIKEFYDEEAKRENISGKESMWNIFWPKELALCQTAALAAWEADHIDDIEIIKVVQFFFFTQWFELKKYAAKKEISIIGDIPIFVALDSSDVWANQSFFQLDKDGIPLNVAGVPPDYFSVTGQLWGNPLYDWGAMKKTSYHWWINRIRHVLTIVDYVRIDHFRGFDEYWAVPYGEKTAEKGKWMPGPGKELFDYIKNELGSIPIIAEDLGIITDSVRKLRDRCGFPGMKVLQFAFDTAEVKEQGMTNSFLPHMYNENCVVYTGTHDNQTLQGWLNSISLKQLLLVASYTAGQKLCEDEALAMRNSGELCDKIIISAFASTAKFTVIPLQDIFNIDDRGRMNTPSTTGINWGWRMSSHLLTRDKAIELRFLSYIYGRNL